MGGGMGGMMAIMGVADLAEANNISIENQALKSGLDGVSITG
jgi:hypothetical protein